MTLKPANLGIALIALIAPALLAQPAFAQYQQYLQDAEAAAARGDNVAAIQLYQSAIVYGPAQSEPYIRIAEFYVTEDQPALAEKYFGIALQLEPAHPPALKGLAMLALAEGDLQAAAGHHALLMEACAPACPEAAEVGAALNVAPAGDGE